MRKKWITIAVCLVTLLSSSTLVLAADSVKIVFCQRIVDRDPVGANDSFAATIGWVYCHTTVANNGEPTNVHHDWYYQDAFINRQTLPVGTSPSWRTFSAKQMSPAWIGKWEVIVRAENGREIGRQSFSIVAAPE